MVEAENGPKPSNAVRLACVYLVLLVSATLWLAYGIDDNTNAAMGIAMFLAIPFAVGGLFSVAFDPRGENSPMGCAVYPSLFLLATVTIAYIVFGEGALCIAIILPLWIPAAIGGTLANRWLYWRRKQAGDDDRWRLRSSVWVALPSLAFATDAAAPPRWQEHEVVREITVSAPAREVWPLLVEIRNIGPDEGRRNLTHDVLGVPRPTDARLVLRQGAWVREAKWGEGARFEERVTAFQPEKYLAWRFAFPDDSIRLHTDRHISPYGPVLRVLSGRYDLHANNPNTTTIRLTTRYATRLRIDGYLSWWGERFLGDVQANVLAIIAGRVEKHTVSIAYKAP